MAASAYRPVNDRPVNNPITSPGTYNYDNPITYNTPTYNEYRSYDPNQSANQLAQVDDYYSRLVNQKKSLEALTNSDNSLLPVGARLAASQALEKIISQMGDLSAVRQRVDAVQTGEQVASDMQKRQISSDADRLFRTASEGGTPSQAQGMLAKQQGYLADMSKMQSDRIQNQNQSMVASARTYNPAMSRAASFATASQRADLSGRANDGSRDLAGQSMALGAQEMEEARGARSKYALGQQAQNDAAANAIRANNISYSQLQQQGAAQQGIANRDRAAGINQYHAQAEDEALKREISDKNYSTSLFKSLYPL